MTRTLALVLASSLAHSLTALPCAAQSASAQPGSAASDAADDAVLRLYDVRDLVASMPQPAEATASRMWFRAGEAPFADSTPPAQASPPIDALMDAVCGSLAYDMRPLSPGVYMIAASAPAHERITALLNDTREIYMESYAAEVSCFLVDRSSVPGVGERCTIEPTTAFSRISSVVARRGPAVVASTQSISYIADWMPVVGTQAVGYDPQTSEVEEGVRFMVVAGAGPESASSTLVRLSGSISRVKMDEAKHPAMGETGPLTLGVPTTISRAVDSNLRVDFGQPFVAAVVDAFEADRSIVIVVTLKKAREAK